VTIEPDVAALASGGFDVAIDFSSADLLPKLAPVVASVGAALVSGTTGLSADAERALEEASRRVPVLWEPNMSVGVFVLGQLLRDAIRALGDDFDVEIVETHHKKKADAPSGTALRLAEIAESSMKATPGPRRHGREGRPGERTPREVGLHAVRGGDVVGDHSVHLIGLGERIELVHRATSRDLFAHGALRAASWTAGKPAGRYRLADVLAE
jgi:4-hydroxy-tetrahydrodipicolinate reductase